MRSPPKGSDALDQILQFLRSEGFYAAEDALIRELEDRLPEGEESRSAGSSPSQPHSSPILIPESQQPRADSSPISGARVPVPTRYSVLAWESRCCRDAAELRDHAVGCHGVERNDCCSGHSAPQQESLPTAIWSSSRQDLASACLPE